MRDIDIKEEDSIRCFVAEECGCTLFNGTSCSTNFSPDYYSIRRNECAELDPRFTRLGHYGTNNGQFLRWVSYT